MGLTDSRNSAQRQGPKTPAPSGGVDEREEALNAREKRLAHREAALAGRAEREQELLDDAAERDDRADGRDIAASRRDMAANLKAFLQEGSDGGAEARRFAGRDRHHSRADRASSKTDRDKLAEAVTEQEPVSPHRQD